MKKIAAEFGEKPVDKIKPAEIAGSLCTDHDDDAESNSVGAAKSLNTSNAGMQTKGVKHLPDSEDV